MAMSGFGAIEICILDESWNRSIGNIACLFGSRRIRPSDGRGNSSSGSLASSSV